jgi:hypothetical protein
MSVALPIAVDSAGTIEFTMSRGAAEVVCMRRDTDAGVEVCVTFSGLRTAQFLARSEDDARMRAEEIRRSWEALGYVAA